MKTKLQDSATSDYSEISSPLFPKQNEKQTFEHSSFEGTSEERADEIYEELGGCGCFQVLAYVAVGWGMSATSWFVYESGFLTQRPEYTCVYEPGTQVEPECNKDNICAGDSAIQSWDYDYDQEKTLYNWQQQLDLTCSSDLAISMIGSSLFLGWACSLLWLPSIADKRGRKNIFWITMVAQALLYIGLLFTKHLAVMVALWFSFGFLSSVRINVGYVYLMELLPKKAQTPMTSLWNIQEVSIYAFSIIFFWKISRHWFYFCLIGFIWQIISVVLMFFMPESPRYLITAGRYEEARKAFEIIAKFNRKPLEWDERIFASSKANKNSVDDEAAGPIDPIETPSMKYYLQQPKIVFNLIIMSFVWLATSFGYYLILSLINTFKDVYMTALVSSASEVVAYIVAGLFYLKIGVKLSLILSFAISTLGGILILCWGLDHQDSTLFFVFFLMAKFGVACTFNINFTANSYFFPTLFAATAMGVCNFGARLTSAFSYPISSLDEPWPMLMFTTFCGFTCVASFFLKTEEQEESKSPNEEQEK